MGRKVDDFGKFKIICLECGSENVTLEEEIDYDWDENPYTDAICIVCKDCGNFERYSV